METYERIRELRKKYLKLSMESFGNRLGVSRDTINNIEFNRLKKPEQKLSLYKLICSEFNVSEEWLLNGTGDMFTSNESEYSTMIDQIMHGENEFAKNIFKTFALFDVKDWEALERMISKYNSVTDPKPDVSLYDSVPDTPEELEKLFPPIEKDVKRGVG